MILGVLGFCLFVCFVMQVLTFQYKAEFNTNSGEKNNEKIGLYCCLPGARKNNVLDYKKGQ